MKKNKSFFAVKISWILFVLIFLGIAEIFMGKSLLGYYKSETVKMCQNNIDLFMERDDKSFLVIDRELISMMVEDDDFSELSKSYMGAPVDYNEASKRAKLLKDIQDKFNNLCVLYGWDYYYWCYDSNTDTFIDLGVNDYSRRTQFRKAIIKNIHKGQQSLPRNGKWFIQDKNIMTIFNQGSLYIGSWISIDDYLNSLAKLNMTDSYTVYINDSDGKVAAEKKVSDGKARNIGILKKGTKSFGKYDVKASLENATFDVGFLLDNSIMEKNITFQLILIILALFYLGVVSVMVIYVKRKIFNPLTYFYNNISKFSEKTRFEDMYGLVELDEAGKMFNKLSEEIHKLKINYYEEKLKCQKVELDYAQVQIRPHFFINCLSVIYSMSQIDQTEEIQELCYNISEYMRYLFNGSTEKILLKDETDLVEHYLQVIQRVYGQAFHYDIKIDEAVMNYEIPPLIVQTFVENAIKHADVGAEKPVEIEVHAFLKQTYDQERLCLSIQDTGNGFPKDVLEQLRTGNLKRMDSSHQIGIMNIMQRVQIIYGASGNIIFDNNEKGARVYIELPAELRASDSGFLAKECKE
jgi:sensor histidine kinase YesM